MLIKIKNNLLLILFKKLLIFKDYIDLFCFKANKFHFFYKKIFYKLKLLK